MVVLGATNSELDGKHVEHGINNVVAGPSPSAATAAMVVIARLLLLP